MAFQLCYLGCYASAAGSVLPKLKYTSPDNTVSRCLYVALGQYTLFGVQGAQCFAGYAPAPDAVLVSDEECSVACPGSPRNACGGVGTVAVYRIGSC
jgi:hypothetical protein